jgi:catechol 2,3-dioxygenase-like lactoylglutathione lyase family enzyme
VTALAGDPRGNLGFYREVLGLRLVKRTVLTFRQEIGQGLGRWP